VRRKDLFEKSNKISTACFLVMLSIFTPAKNILFFILPAFIIHCMEFQTPVSCAARGAAATSDM